MTGPHHVPVVRFSWIVNNDFSLTENQFRKTLVLPPAKKGNCMVTLEPIKAPSLKDVFIKEFEKMIFSGSFEIGEKLPPERELAKEMGVSRPVVHEGLVNLASKGLVSMRPRIGTVINDYRKEGSVFLLSALFEYSNGPVSEKLLKSLLDMRMLFESENAKLAACNRTKQHIDQFHTILDQEKKINTRGSIEIGSPIDQIDPGALKEIVDLDFAFHHLISMASDNLIYPVLLNSLKPFYISFTKKFFLDYSVRSKVFQFHRQLVTVIADQDSDKSQTIMKQMLLHGEKHLASVLKKKQGV
jgi:GntR family transcriptional repressor for pyruvate dehydrogenase complex